MNKSMSCMPRLRSLVLAAALFAGTSAAWAQVEAVSVNPTKIYAAVGDPVAFAVSYTGGEVAATDLVVTYTANTTSPVLAPNAACRSQATPSPYASTNPNEFYVLWDTAAVTYPLSCGGAAGAAAMATFAGVAGSFSGGKYTITVLNGASFGVTNETANDVTVCQKPAVTSVSAPAAAPEGTAQVFTVNFTPAIAAGCEGINIPVVLSGPATSAPDSVTVTN